MVPFGLFKTINDFVSYQQTCEYTQLCSTSLYKSPKRLNFFLWGFATHKENFCSFCPAFFWPFYYPARQGNNLIDSQGVGGWLGDMKKVNQEEVGQQESQSRLFASSIYKLDQKSLEKGNRHFMCDDGILYSCQEEGRTL